MKKPKTSAKPLEVRSLKFLWFELELLLQQLFRNLHGIQCRALEQLIARAEQGDRASRWIAQILADATHQHIILARSVLGHGEVIVRDVIDALPAALT